MKKKKTTSKSIIFVSIFILFLIDILTKTIFTNKHFFENYPIFISYTQNLGSSFGLFASIPFYSTIILILSLITIAILIKFHKQFTNNKLLTYFFIFLTSGLIGNTFDRLIFGFVKDFIALKGLFICNFADIYITIAAILIILYELKQK